MNDKGSKIVTSKLSSNAVKAIGERVVANELTYRGWVAINANSGEENAPNIDIIALNKNKRITIQVKSSTASSHKGHYFLGYKKGDNAHFNTKYGPIADYIIAVYIFSPTNYTCLVLPVNEAERVCTIHNKHWMSKLKRDGNIRSENFPVYIKEDHAQEYGVSIGEYIEAWHLLDGA